LPALDGIHDLLGPHPQVALGDLGLSANDSSAVPVATACFDLTPSYVGVLLEKGT